MRRVVARRLRVLLVDDHPMVREGLRSMLRDKTIMIAGEAATGKDAVARAMEHQPDLIVLDMKLPDADGLDVLQQLKRVAPQAVVLIVSMHDDPMRVCRAIEAGAAGWVLKGADREELLAAVRAVREGELVLPPPLLRAILSSARTHEASRSGDSARGARLSSIELDVLRLLAAGLTNKEIGARLRWSVSTVKKYVTRILEALEVSDRTQAAVRAVQRGLVP